MMAEQLAFDLPIVTAFGRDDFFVSAANSEAVAAIENWRLWPLNKLVLAGPAGAGKSHLSQIWAGMLDIDVFRAQDDWDIEDIDGAACVEDLQEIAGNRAIEEKLFHLHNLQAQKGMPFLMTGRGVPRDWNIALPDLASRIMGSHLVQLGAPDDTLLAAVLLKQLADRQVQIEPGVVDYILRRAERSFARMRVLVVLLDQKSLQLKKPVGQRMVRDVIALMEDGS
jgi:chromosomal replication initiation ATPase DnaA